MLDNKLDQNEPNKGRDLRLLCHSLKSCFQYILLTFYFSNMCADSIPFLTQLHSTETLKRHLAIIDIMNFINFRKGQMLLKLKRKSDITSLSLLFVGGCLNSPIIIISFKLGNFNQ